MVAKITVPGSIKRALNYNEQKLRQGKAHCIYAHRFLKEAAQLNFYEKLHRFEALTILNKRAATNTVHISLNFGPQETLAREKLAQIAAVYMDKIGFGGQPYLVYQHLDAGHPHLHIVTTNIQSDGKRISLHNLGKNASNRARKEIETAYGLQKAGERKNSPSGATTLLPPARVSYGKSELIRSVSNVLNAVLPTYRYSSLAELNAVLRLYNITADRGAPTSPMYQRGGLVYRVLDEAGRKTGVPIKASALHQKPTLSFLEQQFRENEGRKEPHKKSLKATVDWILLNPPSSLRAFEQALQQARISLVVRQNAGGPVYGLTYIDHRSRCVFNGSDLGKAYSAKAILEKCGSAPILTAAAAEERLPERKPGDHLQPVPSVSSAFSAEATQLLPALMDPLERHDEIPYALKRRRAPKRKPRH